MLSLITCNHKLEVFEDLKERKTTNKVYRHNSYWFISDRCIYRFIVKVFWLSNGSKPVWSQVLTSDWSCSSVQQAQWKNGTVSQQWVSFFIASVISSDALQGLLLIIIRVVCSKYVIVQCRTELLTEDQLSVKLSPFSVRSLSTDQQCSQSWYLVSCFYTVSVL